MPSVVKNQSQLRVPPTPCTALLPGIGKFRPECLTALLLPAAGLPMIMYHGSSYRAEAPRVRPSLDVLTVLMASSIALRSTAASLRAPEVGPASADEAIASLSLAAARRRQAARPSRQTPQAASSTRPASKAQIAAISSVSAPNRRNAAS